MNVSFLIFLILFQSPRRLQENEKLCTSIIEGMECPYGDGCKYSHDKEAYLAKHSDQLPGACSNFDQFGWCRYGVTCMFRNAHGTPPSTVTLSSVTTPASISTVSCTPSVTTLAASSDSTTAPTSNRVSRDLQMRLRRREYCFKVTNDVLKELSHGRLRHMLHAIITVFILFIFQSYSKVNNLLLFNFE